MRIVSAVLAACDPKAATARGARELGLARGGAPWVLAIGKAAIGMAEGLADVCGTPERHLIVTVDGPAAGPLPNVLRSDHPLPTQRSVDAGRAVKRFIGEAQTAGAPSLTVLMSGGASSLICEPIPGLELEEYRTLVRAMLTDGWRIDRVNAVRRAIDNLKGGRLAELAVPLPIDLLIASDVIGDQLDDVGSGPFVQSTTGSDAARSLLTRLAGAHGGALTALTCQPHPPRVEPPRRTSIVLSNATAVAAARAATVAEGLLVMHADTGEAGIVPGAVRALETAKHREAVVWGGEWDVPVAVAGFGGRAQALAIWLRAAISQARVCGLLLATDGVDGTVPDGAMPAAGAFVWSGMSWPPDEVAQLSARHATLAEAVARRDEGADYEAVYDWLGANSYLRMAWRDACRPAREPPAHIFTGPTGTNVNDVLVAWRL